MKILCAPLVLLLLLPFAAEAQNNPDATAAPGSPTLTPPPIKMGLWKTVNTATMAGLQLPPDVAARMEAMGKSLGTSKTVNTLSCITPKKWQQMFNGDPRSQNCTFSNVHQSSTALSADITCTSGQGHQTTGHMDMTFDSETKMHGKFHMSMAMAPQSQPMTIDSTLQSEYQGSDCQGISPDSPKIVH